MVQQRREPGHGASVAPPLGPGRIRLAEMPGPMSGLSPPRSGRPGVEAFPPAGSFPSPPSSVLHLAPPPSFPPCDCGSSHMAFDSRLGLGLRDVTNLRGSFPHPTGSLCTLRPRRYQTHPQHSLPGGSLGPTRAGPSPAGSRRLCPAHGDFVGIGRLENRRSRCGSTARCPFLCPARFPVTLARLRLLYPRSFTSTHAPGDVEHPMSWEHQEAEARFVWKK
jgi:hypothetical protein